jgi:hypothetical protein
MSREIVQKLYDGKAFKPAPSLWELAMAHVPLADFGLPAPPEERIRRGLVEGDGVSLLVGDPGSGKSSVFAYLAAALSKRGTDTEPPRRYLPVFVPVGSRPDSSGSIDAFGSIAIREVLDTLRDSLPEPLRQKLERGSAAQVTRKHVAPRFNARLAGEVINGMGPEIGVQLGGDVLEVVGKHGLDSRGGIRTLGDVVRAHGLELILFIEDTDAWARGDGPRQAQSFFRHVARPLCNEVDVAVGIAVQVAWVEDPELRLAEVQDVSARAVTVARMPRPRSETEATRVVEGVLDRRIRNGLDDSAEAGDHPAKAVFAADALGSLGHDFYATGSMREPLTRVRDTFDRSAEDLPDQITLSHMLESL